MFDRRLAANFDWLLLLLICIVTIEGVVVIYSATFSDAVRQSNPLYLRQIYWLLLGVAAIFVVISIDYHHLGRWSYALYAINVGLLMFLLFKGGDAKVARWLKIGGVSFQPSEFMKLTMILVLGQYFQRNSGRGTTMKDILIPCILMGIPLALIVKQPDLGTAITLVPVFLVILLVAGVRRRYLAGMIGMGLMAAPIAWMYLKPYQKQRILTFIDPTQDPLGAGYHLMQSKIAVGSGGWFGKGFLAGTQNRLDFLPAQHTDFIFSVLSEEWGFIGAFVTLLIFFFILLRGVEIASQAKDPLGVVLATGIVASLAAHIVINVGMVTGLLPITGLPFPLLSYGGSSTLTTLIGMGMLFNIRMRRFSTV